MLHAKSVEKRPKILKDYKDLIRVIKKARHRPDPNLALSRSCEKTMGNSARKLSGFSAAKHKQLAQAAPQPFTCEICMEPRAPNHKFDNGKRCSHPLCCDCISQYVDCKARENTAEVVCPHVGCTKLLDPISTRPFIAAEAFNRWCDALCESAVSGKAKAYCPNKACGELVLHNECGGRRGRRPDGTKAECPRCKKVFCFKCQVAWHAGYGCENSGVKRDRNDVLFGIVVEKKKWRSCPRCNTCVELVSGCNVVTCRCKQSFCYYCGGKSTFGHLFNCKGVWHSNGI